MIGCQGSGKPIVALGASWCLGVLVVKPGRGLNEKGGPENRTRPSSSFLWNLFQSVKSVFYATCPSNRRLRRSGARCWYDLQSAAYMAWLRFA